MVSCWKWLRTLRARWFGSRIHQAGYRNRCSAVPPGARAVSEAWQKGRKVAHLKMSTKARSVAFNRSSQSILEELAAPLGESSSRFGRVFPGATCVYMYISLICRHTEYVYIHREYILVYKVYIIYILQLHYIYITTLVILIINIYIHTYFSPTISYIYIFIYLSHMSFSTSPLFFHSS